MYKYLWEYTCHYFGKSARLQNRDVKFPQVCCCNAAGRSFHNRTRWASAVTCLYELASHSLPSTVNQGPQVKTPCPFIDVSYIQNRLLTSCLNLIVATVWASTKLYSLSLFVLRQCGPAQSQWRGCQSWNALAFARDGRTALDADKNAAMYVDWINTFVNSQ